MAGSSSPGGLRGSGTDTGWLIAGGVRGVGHLAFIAQNRESVSFDCLF